MRKVYVMKMRKIKVITDSCSDLSRELLEKYDIDYAQMNTVYKGEQTKASLLWEYYSPKELYDTMRGGDRVTTTQVPVEEFMRIFKQYLDADYDIIYIGCTVKLSGSVNTAAVVANQLKDEYPDARIEVVDSLNSTLGEGMIAMRAAELVKDGKSIDEVLAEILPLRNHANQFATVHTLEWMRKAGRVKAGKAFFGNLMGVKPILISDVDGMQAAVKKVKGRQNSLKEIVNMLAEATEGHEPQTIYVAHADCSEEEMDWFRAYVREKINCTDIITVYIGPIIGATVGPETVGIWGYGKEVTVSADELNA